MLGLFKIGPKSIGMTETEGDLSISSIPFETEGLGFKGSPHRNQTELSPKFKKYLAFTPPSTSYLSLFLTYHLSLSSPLASYIALPFLLVIVAATHSSLSLSSLPFSPWCDAALAMVVGLSLSSFWAILF